MANGFFCGFFFPHPGFPPLWTVGRTLILCSGATGAQLGALASISQKFKIFFFFFFFFFSFFSFLLFSSSSDPVSENGQAAVDDH